MPTPVFPSRESPGRTVFIGRRKAAALHEMEPGASARGSWLHVSDSGSQSPPVSDVGTVAASCCGGGSSTLAGRSMRLRCLLAQGPAGRYHALSLASLLPNY
jgi:hypothetical protein